MERERTHRDAARLLFNIRALADLSAEIASAHDLPTTAKSSLMMIGGAVSATKSALLLRGRSLPRLEMVVQRGLPPGAAEVSIPLADGLIETLRRTGTAVAVAPGAPDPFVPLLTGVFPEARVYAPLVVRDELLGVLALGPKLTRQPYGEHDLELIFALATMLSSGIHSHRLIQGLQESNQRLRDTQEQLLRAERLATLGELSAGIAHEVKNPLTSIRGFAVMLADAPDAPPEEVREYAQVIVQASDQLKGIIDELRDYAKGVRRSYELAPVSLAEIVEATLSFTKFSRELRLVDLRKEVDGQVVVSVNRDRIQQVLLNLLRNAAQAMPDPRRGRITLRVTSEPGFGRLEVTDNGSGIPEEAREKIWESWYTTKGAEGTGLGLGIARKIVEDHGGTLELVESRVGEGSTFALRLPLAETGASGAGGDPRGAGAGVSRLQEEGTP